MPVHNHGENICRTLYILAQFLFPTSEREIDYYQQKVNSQTAQRVAERPKTQEFPEIRGTDGRVLSQPQCKFRYLYFKISENQLQSI